MLAMPMIKCPSNSELYRTLKPSKNTKKNKIYIYNYFILDKIVTASMKIYMNLKISKMTN